MTTVLSSQRLISRSAALPATPPVYRWEVLRGLSGIKRLAGEWNTLAWAGNLSPTADALWMSCFWRAFSNRDDALYVHALYRDATLAAVLPLQRTGHLVGAWSSVCNGHTPYTLFACAAEEPAVAAQLLEHLLQSADCLDLERFHADGPLARALLAEARTRRLPAALEERPGDTWLALPADWQSFRSGLSANLRKHTEQALRRLRELGSLDFSVVTSSEGLESVLDECLTLEALGWKGVRGSPIKANPRTLSFYTELAQASALAGRLALYTLRLNGRLIAFDYCLRGQGRIDLLKIGYHPELGRYSPGNVLRYLVLECEIGRGEVSSYHLGPPSDWKRRWTRQVAPLVRLRIYKRSPKTMIACRVGPLLRNRLKQCSWLRATVKRARALGLLR